MPLAQLVLQQLSIVLIGDFNPKIFQPAWFGAEDLLRPQEVEHAEIRIIHHDVAVFKLEWMQLQVTQDRFEVRTNQDPYFEILRDLVKGTFNLLHHTPLKVMGINHGKHFRINSEEDWHQFGHLVAPKDAWGEMLNAPGLRSLTMEESQRRDGLKGHFRITIQPSEETSPGVFFNVNDHYEAKDVNTVLGSGEIIKILDQSFERSSIRANETISSLWRYYEQSVEATGNAI